MWIFLQLSRRWPSILRPFQWITLPLSRRLPMILVQLSRCLPLLLLHLPRRYDSALALVTPVILTALVSMIAVNFIPVDSAIPVQIYATQDAYWATKGTPLALTLQDHQDIHGDVHDELYDNCDHQDDDAFSA